MTEKEILLSEAKEAYYQGNPIMGDEEYDALEREIGLENKSEIGYHSENYTVKHPFMMGSLSKVQIKNDSLSWNDRLESIRKYIGFNDFELTPKLDGCSFEIEFNGNTKNISTRGDGRYGKDISCHIGNQTDIFIRRIKNIMSKYGDYKDFIYRGEVLVSFDDYEDNFKNEFVNTRAFVAGALNRPESTSHDDYLVIRIYDIRTKDNRHFDIAGTPELANIKEIIMPERIDGARFTPKKFEALYERMENMRRLYEFPLDGFVLKTICSKRSCEEDERPKDCVAVKFKPQIKKTVIKDIEWSLSVKNSEYYPIAVVEDVILDSKTVNHVSLANYGKIIKGGASIGAEVLISMAGDIIPYLYEVTKKSDSEVIVPEDTYIDGVHLYKKQSEEEIIKNNFIASCETLQIPLIGPAMALKLSEYDPLCDHIFKFDWSGYSSSVKMTKNEMKAAASFKDVINKFSLAQVIQSLNIPLCGERLSQECANYISHNTYDFTSMASDGYMWVKDNESKNMKKLLLILETMKNLGADTDKFFAKSETVKSDSVKIIMTGSPKEFGYATKKDFLKEFPQYSETTKWDECKILFTDDLDSSSSKMSKAKKLGIDIRLYGK